MLTKTSLALAILVLLSACTENAEIGDLAGHVDSIGPASFDGRVLSVPFSTWDEDGDPLDVDVSFARGDGTFEPLIVLEDLASEVAVSTAHTFIWGPDSQYSEAITSVETTAIRVRMFVIGRPDSELILGPFTPTLLGDD